MSKKYWFDEDGSKITITMSLAIKSGGMRKCFFPFLYSPGYKGILTEPDLTNCATRLEAEEIVQLHADKHGWKTFEDDVQATEVCHVS
ncbi:MAG: hypothetical protein WC455_11760 [Dehalococcoidia bacterium]|jgi:hypothetical protein